MYAVIWMNEALDELADAFVQADLPLRSVIEEVVLRFNAQLASDPTEVGESRDGNERIAFDKPVIITFVVDEPIIGVARVTHFRTY